MHLIPHEYGCLPPGPRRRRSNGSNEGGNTVERKGGGGGGGRRRENGRIERARPRRREQDEKCNYDFEKWARPLSRKRTECSLGTTGSSLEQRVSSFQIRSAGIRSVIATTRITNVFLRGNVDAVNFRRAASRYLAPRKLQSNRANNRFVFFYYY